MAKTNNQHNKTDSQIIAGLHLILSEDGLFRIADRSGSMPVAGYDSPDRAWETVAYINYDDHLDLILGEIKKQYPDAMIGFHSDMGTKDKLYHAYFLPADYRKEGEYSANELTPSKAMATAYANYLRTWEKFDDEYTPIKMLPGGKSFYFKWPNEYLGFTTNMGDLAVELLSNHNPYRDRANKNYQLTKYQVEIVINKLIQRDATVIVFDSFTMHNYYEENFNAYW